MQPKHGLPDSMIRDTRRDSWVMVLPARDFLPEDYNSDRSPVEPRRLIPSGGVAQRPLSPADRALPWIMLAWACLVWTFLLFDLGHL